MNIAWKIAYVLKGIANETLLNTITTERKPVGDGVVRRANEGMEAHRRLWRVIGLDAEDRRRKTELMAQATPEAKALRDEFRAAMLETEYEQNGLGIQMNQRYCDSPLSIIEPDDPGEPRPTFDLVKHTVVTTYPGYHLPHAWVTRDSRSPRQSTLDLCGHGIFTLITGIGGEAWRDHAQAVEAGRKGLVVNVVSIGWRQEFHDAYGDWNTVRGVDDDGAVLVRPDHFVAWRCRSVEDVSPQRLAEVFDALLSSP